MQKLALPLSSIIVSMILILGLIISPTLRPEELTYGPIQSGDRLWDIALQLRSDSSISRYQVMIALLKANPQAFRIPCNLNSLKIGNRLLVPSLAEMQILTPQQALTEFNRQNAEWQLARRQQQQIICQPLTNDTSIIKKETKPEKDKSEEIKPEQDNKINVKHDYAVTTPVSPITVSSSPNNSATDSQWLVTDFFNHWQDKISAWLASVTKGPNLSWLSTPWLLPLLISLVIIGILIALVISQWRRHSLSYHHSVIIKDQNREQLSSEPLLSTLEIQQLHEEAKLTKSAASSTSQEATVAVEENSSSTKFSAIDEIKEKLDNVRSYLAEEEQFIQRTLREVIQKGTPEQQLEAKQLYEISKKINYLKKDRKYLPVAAPMDNSSYLQQVEQQLTLSKSLPEDPEKFFDLIDKIFATLDYELNTQGKLVDAYINRHKSAPVNIENYQVVGKKESPAFDESNEEISLRKPRPVPKPTRHM
jgi:FimV-like protein